MPSGKSGIGAPAGCNSHSFYSPPAPRPGPRPIRDLLSDSDSRQRPARGGRNPATRVGTQRCLERAGRYLRRFGLGYRAPRKDGPAAGGIPLPWQPCHKHRVWGFGLSSNGSTPLEKWQAVCRQHRAGYQVPVTPRKDGAAGRPEFGYQRYSCA